MLTPSTYFTFSPCLREVFQIRCSLKTRFQLDGLRGQPAALSIIAFEVRYKVVLSRSHYKDSPHGYCFITALACAPNSSWIATLCQLTRTQPRHTVIFPFIADSLTPLIIPAHTLLNS
jgi:hypothetical protein